MNKHKLKPVTFQDLTDMKDTPLDLIPSTGIQEDQVFEVHWFYKDAERVKLIGFNCENSEVTYVCMEATPTAGKRVKFTCINDSPQDLFVEYEEAAIATMDDDDESTPEELEWFHITSSSDFRTSVSKESRSHAAKQYRMVQSLRIYEEHEDEIERVNVALMSGIFDRAAHDTKRARTCKVLVRDIPNACWDALKRYYEELAEDPMVMKRVVESDANTTHTVAEFSWTY